MVEEKQNNELITNLTYYYIILKYKTVNTPKVQEYLKYASSTSVSVEQYQIHTKQRMKYQILCGQITQSGNNIIASTNSSLEETELRRASPFH